MEGWERQGLTTVHAAGRRARRIASAAALLVAVVLVVVLVWARLHVHAHAAVVDPGDEGHETDSWTIRW